MSTHPDRQLGLDSRTWSAVADTDPAGAFSLNPPHALSFVDWLIFAAVVTVMVGVGVNFNRKAGRTLESFFVSDRMLPWYIAGASMTATSFAADTPLWLSSLVRQHGVAAAWQFWSPFAGAALATVYFGRLWRRMGFVTDIELFEARYSGKMAGVLRGTSGAVGALIYCPLIVSWVFKGMETIAREAMGLPPEYRALTTVIAMSAALVVCVPAGLLGLAYSEFVQFFVAIAGTLVLAVYSVRAVGGLDALVHALSATKAHGIARDLGVLPTLGTGGDSMTPWNAVGLFGILWMITATTTGYHAQRLLATSNQRQASYAQAMFTVVYYGVLAWPWIIVALCSLVLLPDLHTADQAVAYPRMIVQVLPAGLRGLLVASMTCAFLSTVSSIFNWGASYLANDLYKRFVQPAAEPKVQVLVGRLATIFIAAEGAVISLWAEDIQQLLTIFYVLAAGEAVLRMLRWLWWRLTVQGDLAGLLAGWILALLLLFGRVFDAPARSVFGWEADVNLSTAPGLLGARMLFVLLGQTVVVVTVSLLTPPTPRGVLAAFAARALPLRMGWRPVLDTMNPRGECSELLGRTLLSWVIGIGAMLCLLVGLGQLLLGSFASGSGGVMLFAVGAIVSVRRIRADSSRKDLA